MSSPMRASKEEREAAKAAERAAKDAIKARRDAIKAQRAVYKGWAAGLKAKETPEVKEGLAHAADADFMVLGGGLPTLLRVLKSKVWACVCGGRGVCVCMWGAGWALCASVGSRRRWVPVNAHASLWRSLAVIHAPTPRSAPRFFLFPRALTTPSVAGEDD
jgi:hypothetical protein